MKDAVYFSPDLLMACSPAAYLYCPCNRCQYGDNSGHFRVQGPEISRSYCGLFEIIIWLLAIGQIMKNLSNPICYIAYAGGFAMGNFVGICIAEKLSLGKALLRVITNKDAASLIEDFKSQGYGVTSFDGQGSMGRVKLVLSIIHRNHLAEAVEIVTKFDPSAFYSIEDVGFAEKGVFAVKQRWYSNVLNGLFRPFRKGK